MSVFAKGHVAAISGAASGIGLAAARAFAARGMRLCLFDRSAEALQAAAHELGAHAVVGDVSKWEDVARWRDATLAEFGAAHVVMNNAAIEGGSQSFGALPRWREILGVNLWGVIHGVEAFAEPMLARGDFGAIVNTGSKQGITNPPGDPAYGTAKAGVRALSEQLAHALRNVPGARLSAHLLVPGFTYTGLNAKPGQAKPAAAWTAEQVVERMIAGVEAGQFYIYCPDNAVSEELDALRLKWSVGDIVEKRPALSRWHPDWKDAFSAYVAKELKSPPSR